MSVYWPELPYPPAPVFEDAAAPAVVGGHETVLVVEDEPLLRALALRTLQGLGYRCLIAEKAAAALELVEHDPETIDLVVTDVVMPGTSGGALGELLARLRPDLPLLYTSGYSDEEAIRRGLLVQGRPFLQKPFTPSDLARRVRELLDTPTHPV